MFPKRIKELRIQAGLSQKKLAEKLFISQQSVGKWESGISKPSPETTLKLATLFGVSTDYLLGLTDDPKGQFVVELTDSDPQVDSILNKARRLNAQGLERLEQYADDLISSGNYPKIVYTSDVAARSGEKGKTVVTKEQADEVLRLLDSAPDDEEF